MRPSSTLMISIILYFVAGIGGMPQASSQTASPVPASLVRINFFYDANLNGTQDPGEAALADLAISSPGYFLREKDGSIKVRKNQDLTLRVNGNSPAGKPLCNVTLREPLSVILLPAFICPVGDRDMKIGLADGWLTSPLRPRQMMMDDYVAVLKNPHSWKIQSDRFYPKGWSYPRNYFYYGYRIPEGGLAGTPHLAFDIWARPGTPVLASAPGTVVAPLFDWRFGIGGEYGTVYYNHIVPAVRIGDRVKRYDVVGYIAENQGNHVHFELRPAPEKILSAFPGVRESFFLKSPLNREPVPEIPYFGR
ncbi:MAG: M23 family metallopeptidase [Spirochaetes bacterium]|nr:M23 family metallopeptidase [Spirochaetota bacterium]